jgi:hypothetical protein
MGKINIYYNNLYYNIYMSNYNLHAVIIKKNIDLNEAKRISKEFIRGNKHFYRETENSYRFRNYPKTYFKPKSYRSKKINDDITLIYGDVKKEYIDKIDNTLYGEGLFDFLKSKFNAIVSPRLDYSDSAKEILSKYGSLDINSIMIYRTPIQSAISQLLNVISLGKFDKLKKKYNFDELFHLALIVNVSGRNIIIEKNEVVNISFNYQTTNKTQTMNVNLENQKMNINDMLTKTLNRIGPNKFFVYDSFSQNCQVFIRDILETNNLYSDDINNFVFQDVSELMKELPEFTRKGARFITDVGAFFRKLTGTGEMEGGCNECSDSEYKDVIVQYPKNINGEHLEYIEVMSNLLKIIDKQFAIIKSMTNE